MTDLSLSTLPAQTQSQKIAPAALLVSAGASVAAPAGVNGTSAKADGSKPDAGKSARSDSAMGNSPLNSVEAFENYCSQVQTRLAEHAAQRAHFLQSAYERLTRLLHTARSVEDAALYNELWQHRVAVRELLEALHQVSAAPAASPAISQSATGSSALLDTASASFASVAAPLAASPPPSAAPAASSSALPTLSPSLSTSAAQTAAPAPNGAGTTALSIMGNVPTPVSDLVSDALIPPAKPLPLQEASGLNGHAARPVSTDDGAANGTTLQEAASPLKTDGQATSSRPTLTQSLPSVPDLADTAPAEYAPRPLRQAVRPLADITADATRLRESLKGWEKHHPLRSARSDSNSIEGLNVPNCLRLRAVACRMRRLEEEGGDAEIGEVIELARDIEDILDDGG